MTRTGIALLVSAGCVPPTTACNCWGTAQGRGRLPGCALGPSLGTRVGWLQGAGSGGLDGVGSGSQLP